MQLVYPIPIIHACFQDCIESFRYIFFRLFIHIYYLISVGSYIPPQLRFSEAPSWNSYSQDSSGRGENRPRFFKMISILANHQCCEISWYLSVWPTSDIYSITHPLFVFSILGLWRYYGVSIDGNNLVIHHVLYLRFPC